LQTKNVEGKLYPLIKFKKQFYLI